MSKVWSRKRPCKVEDEYIGGDEFNWWIRDCDGESIVSGTSFSCDLSLTMEKELRKAWDRFADDLQARVAEAERLAQELVTLRDQAAKIP